MSFKLTWLPEVLTEAGLRISEIDGWKERGHGDMGEVKGVLCHHTAGRLEGIMPSLDTIVHGRPDLSGPLANLGLGRDGTFFIVAAGRAFHAGAGNWMGITQGNSQMIGIEAENTGHANDTPWPVVQIRAYHHGVAAILRHLGLNADRCAAHKEYALPHGRKNDPDFNMVQFRTAVATLLADPSSPLPPIPKESPAPDGKLRLTLRRGAQGEFVTLLQTRLHLASDGVFGPKTEAHVREFQRAHGLVPDGIVGPKSWIIVDTLP